MERRNRWAEKDQVGDGWQELLTALESDLEEMVPGYVVDQIKEKFGGLRYYVTLPDGTEEELAQQFHARIDEAEILSKVTCEECGAPGEIGGLGWLRCLCGFCRAKWDEARRIWKENHL